MVTFIISEKEEERETERERVRERDECRGEKTRTGIEVIEVMRLEE